MNLDLIFTMTTTIPRRAGWIAFLLIILLAATILIFAPEERELGSGIRSVYVHVAMIWTGMSGIVLAGLLGLGAAVFNKADLQSWAKSITWVALGMFAGGVIMSIVAAGINWGGVFWQEPRTNTVLQVMAFTLIVQVINSWPVSLRIRGGLNFLLACLLLFLVFTTPLVLHPGDAARTANSLAIRFTFITLYVLCMTAAAWLVLELRTRES